MQQTYVEQRDDRHWEQGMCVPLDSIASRFLAGLPPESTADCFPWLTLEQIYGAITYCLGHRPEIAASLTAADTEYEVLRQRVRAEYLCLSRKLDELLQPNQSLTHETSSISGR